MILAGISGFSRFRGDFGEEKFGPKRLITHSKLGESATSIEIVPSGTIVIAYSYQLANEISQIRFILSFLMRLFLTLL